MNGDRSALVNPSDRMGQVVLPSLIDGKPQEVISYGKCSSVIASIHGLSCAACRRYLEELAARAREFAEWEGRVVIVSAERSGGLEIPFALLLDSDGQLKRAARIGIPSILIVDRWGSVQLRHEAREAHDFLAPSEIEDWLRYLAIQCPECQGEVF
ncbi:TlpA family protein disulfide reductase [Pyrinomonas methylaliphatogenes]|uniref:AhpC/TSA family protein n=1 Tax=Pyrinomonas methylaliphatogenes TaxID=454194 RepID=A0A0B6WU36_9BACT|nr:redoxin domain-containing protein [Pyrinomonas methylaliphatogenes]CDM64197.1 AhpC/TSA family protein [Pyrinomonas methylaliphatogenes]